MSADTGLTIALPHFAGPGSGEGAMTWEYYKLPGFEDVNNFAGNYQGYGLTTVILAYLTQIWAELKRPLRAGPVIAIPISGSGSIDSIGFPGGPRIRNAYIDIAVYPQDTDIIFGELPLYYVGKCGWGGARIQGTSIQTGIGTFAISVAPDITTLSKVEWINHLNSRFEAPYGTNSNLFWWHLKTGVRGFLTLEMMNVEEAMYSSFIDAGVQYQVFNPMLPQPWALGDLDGNLDPTHPP